MSPLFRKSDEKTVAIFDIGNGSIGAAIVRLSQSNAPTILYSYREPITFLPQVSSERLMENMLKLLKSVASHVEKEVWPQYHRNVKEAYCVFSTPWFVADTRVISYEKDTPFMVTRGMVEDILKKDEDAFIASLKDGNYEKVFGINLHILEKKIIHTKLNGYEIQDFLNKKAKQIEITLFLSYMSDLIPKKVEDILNHYFNFRTVNFNSYALASWFAFREQFPHEEHFLFLDISGEVTDVMLHEKGIIAETAAFPAGRSLILRNIVRDMTVPPEVALSFLNMYTKKSVEKRFAADLEKIIKNTQEEWRAAFVEAIQSFKKNTVMPKKVFITADADCAPIFLETLKTSFPKGLQVPNPIFEPIYIGSEVTEQFVHKDHKGILDPFIALESTFLNKIVL
jgi:hypothetical protein